MVLGVLRSMSHRRGATAASALAVVVLLAGCRAEPGEPGERSSPAVTAAATSTSTPTVVPVAGTVAASSSSAPLSTRAEVCAMAAPVPAQAGSFSRVEADVDGDGAKDVVVGYAARAVPRAGDWHLRVDFAAGGSSDLVLVEDPAPGAVVVLGATQLGAEDVPAVFAWTGAGASTRIVGLFRVDGCDLLPMTLLGGQPAGFLVGAAVGHQEGLHCNEVGGRTVLVEVLAEPVGATYRVTRRVYRREGDVLVPDTTVDVIDEPAPPVEAGRIVGCDGVDDGG